MTVVDLLFDEASEAERVIEQSGPKLTREQYVATRRAFDGEERFGESARQAASAACRRHRLVG
jgi:hypothetical protein